MSVKKLLVLAAGLTVIGATAAMAGGPDHMAMPAQPAFQNSVYIDAQLGYASTNTADYTLAGVSVVDNKNGGFAGGVDMGYTFTRNIALEAGWLYLPNAGFANPTNTVTGQVRSWVLYAAAKFSAEVMENLDLFAKAGVGYRNLNWSLNGANSSGNYWLPLMAAGIEYTYGSWLFGAQYTFITGNSSNSTLQDNAGKMNMYTGFVGYKFNV
ncbi:MAG: outer membrane beta-barrel protein [Coxiellaceae bacterium]|nr:outer membrane beta-barrel protein [Coxiellaceae bacterium]